MYKIENNLTQVKHRIQVASQSSKRDFDEISLLAVSKKHSFEKIQVAYGAGQRHFGENYLQEALEKIELNDHPDLIWHFIGPIQSNKTKAISQNFEWVHSVDRLKIAQKLNEHRPESLAPINLCLQVNIDREPSKAGVFPENALNLAQAITIFPKVKLRGLMAIPQKERAAEISSPFERMSCLFKEINSKLENEKMDTLSMGMSDDLEEAIQYGSTFVRVGTAIFGKRN